jgi:hypothetical protein
VNHAVPAPITSIVFPISSVMVKINWIAASEAPTYGIDPYDTENPFITMNLVPQTGDEKDEPEPYIAVSFHISSKDTPNWFWTTFEHVANQGRCDWIGCNDSFGFETIQTITIDESVAAGLPPVARNYTPPNKLTTIDGRSLEAFDLAQTYLGVDRMTPELTTILDAFDIGTAGDVNTTGQPTQQDAAWRSYRHRSRICEHGILHQLSCPCRGQRRRSADPRDLREFAEQCRHSPEPQRNTQSHALQHQPALGPGRQL